MKRFAWFAFCVLAVYAMPLPAQEKESKEAAQSMSPPKPLQDDLCAWMVGEWEGFSVSPMGKTKDWQKVEWGLDGQFVVTTYSSTTVEMTEEQKKKAMETWGMSKEDVENMMNMAYKGMGPMTINPATGEFVGYWFDNWRGMYKGSGKREGNRVTMSWEGPMGTEVRTTEKTGDDTMVVTFKSMDPKGNPMEGRTELKRKKM